MKRKAWAAIPLLLTLAVLGQGLSPPSSAVEYPAIFVDPSSVVNTGLTPTTGFIVSIKTNYTGADIWGYELTLTYNPLVIQGANVTNGDLIVNATHPATFGEGTFDNDAGRLSLTGAYFDAVHGVPRNVTSGDGDDVLANVGFQVVGTGDTPITLGLETRLVDGNGTNIVDARLMPFNIGDGYFRNTAYECVHDGAALSGTLNDTSLYVGRSVSISVDVKNEGNVTERLEVSIYYRVISPSWLVYSTTVDLAKGTTQSIPVVWNTAGWFPGTGNITAVVSEVWGESDTSDNQLVLGEVHVRILGDINEDTDVTVADYLLLIGVFPDPTPPPANPEADLDFDQTIDEDDFVILVGNLGKSE